MLISVTHPQLAPFSLPLQIHDARAAALSHSALAVAGGVNPQGVCQSFCSAQVASRCPTGMQCCPHQEHVLGASPSPSPSPFTNANANMNVSLKSFWFLSFPLVLPPSSSFSNTTVMISAAYSLLLLCPLPPPQAKRSPCATQNGPMPSARDPPAARMSARSDPRSRPASPARPPSLLSYPSHCSRLLAPISPTYTCTASIQFKTDRPWRSAEGTS